jgi:hypothetical protein
MQAALSGSALALADPVSSPANRQRVVAQSRSLASTVAMSTRFGMPQRS